MTLNACDGSREDSADTLIFRSHIPNLSASLTQVQPRCGSCSSYNVDSHEDGSVRCRSCGAVTRHAASHGLAAARDFSKPSARPLEEMYLWTGAEAQQIERTRRGIPLLILGTAFLPLPALEIVGGLLALAGAVLVALGPGPFGRTHRLCTAVSPPLVASALVAAVALGTLYNSTIYSATLFAPGTAPGVAASLQNLLFGGVFIAAVSGLAHVLFVFALQRPWGKVLLWTGYGAQLALSLVVWTTLGPRIDGAVSAGFARLDPEPIYELSGQRVIWALAGVVPAILYIAVYGFTSLRLRRREIPVPPPLESALRESAR